VVGDQIVRLGSKGRWHHGPVRVVRIEKEELDGPIILVTNRIDPETHSAALLAEIYHGRWEIELFFRWFKCVLGRADQWHWFAESPEGVAIQIYCALIAALLLARRSGKLPTKRQMEAIRFHAMGMVSDEELERVLAGAGAKKPR
jgi:IS4 transposase